MTAKVISLHGSVPKAEINQARAEAEAIAAEFDPAQLPEGDAGLIQAARWLPEIQVRVHALYDRFEWLGEREDGITDPINAAEKRVLKILNERPPATVAGAVAKLKFLVVVIREDWDVYYSCGGKDQPALSQVIELLERLDRA